MNKNLCLAVLVFTHVCVFIQPAVGLPLRPEEDTDEPLPAAAMDFMQNIYQSKSAELRSDAKAATPNVWCFLPTTEGVFYYYRLQLRQFIYYSAYVCHKLL